jgi:hypothetical protein
MQTIQIRSHVDADGTVRVQLSSDLAHQEVDLILSYQPAQAVPVIEAEEDSIIGLFVGPADLGTNAEEILTSEVHPMSGFSWKQPLPILDSSSP